jgi:hypothetical protein
MKAFAVIVGVATLLAICGCASERATRSAASCAAPAAYAPAAAYNAASEQNLVWSPFGRPERGWAIYAPAIARTVRSACPAESPAFARAVARWQAQAGLPAHGGVDPATFAAIKTGWERARPFVHVRAAGVCPAPPPESDLSTLPAIDSWRGAVVRLRPGASRALARMIETARREDSSISADPEALTAFSGFREPDYDAARCAREHNCDGIVRAACSSHRTGLAVDLALGAAPGFNVDSSADANRLFQTRTPAYRWLLVNAHRFGFVNYAFEPWHWEWTGEAP